MNKQVINLLPAAFLFFYAVAIPFPAHAYLDPGTGSMIIQIVLGALVGAATVIKLYWYKIKAFINGKKTTPPKETE